MPVKSYFIYICFCISLVLNACNKKRPPTPIITVLPEFEAGRAQGVIQVPEMSEISGMVASQNMPGMLWAHNDGGDQPVVYLIDSKANWQGTFRLSNAANRDWEDIATAKINGENYLLLSDTGDNSSVFNNDYYIYRCKEPKANTAAEQNINSTEKISFKYPDGSRDAEALLVDHATNDIYIITKREAKARIYVLPYPQKTNSQITASFVAELPFGGELGGVPMGATGGDISWNNSEIIIKNYFQVYYWKLKTGETIRQALTRSYDKLLPYAPIPQEEAICWESNAAGFYTLAEGTTNNNVVQLFYYKKKQ